MAQYKKETVKETIDAAAMEVFSKKGYMDTRIADISKLSGIPVGNIYRYYKSKDDLFDSLIPKDFIDSMKNKLMQKISSWEDKNNFGIHTLISQEFVDFMIDHKGLLLLVFHGSAGTRYETFKSEIVELLTEVFLSNYENRLNINGSEMKKILRLIYEKHIETMSSVFGLPLSDKELKTAIKMINAYHVNGITGFILPNSKKEENDS